MALIKQIAQKKGWNQLRWALSISQSLHSRCLGLHTSRKTDNSVPELAMGLVLVWRRNWMERSPQSCSQWKWCFLNTWGIVGLFSAETNKKNEESTKSHYCNIRDDNVSLPHHLSLLSIQVWEWKNKVLIPSENLLFCQKCVFCQINADVHARTGVLCNWKTAENRKKEVSSYHALNYLESLKHNQLYSATLKSFAWLLLRLTTLGWNFNKGSKYFSKDN